MPEILMNRFPTANSGCGFCDQDKKAWRNFERVDHNHLLTKEVIIENAELVNEATKMCLYPSAMKQLKDETGMNSYSYGLTNQPVDNLKTKQNKII